MSLELIRDTVVNVAEFQQLSEIPKEDRIQKSGVSTIGGISDSPIIANVSEILQLIEIKKIY